MEIILIIFGVFLLYWRCLNYYFIIDDIVRRWEYLYVVPEQSPSPQFYSSKPHPWRHFFPIFVHAINVWIVYLLWGWIPAALFAFSPLSVPGTAWITGSYYAVTTLLTLTSFFFLHTYPNIIGSIISMLFFTAALGSTITCLGFPFIFMIFNPIGLTLFLPLFLYLNGKRFKKGFAIRDMGKKDFFHLRKIPVMTKVVAYYIYKIVFPYRLSFFHSFGEDYTTDPDKRKNLESLNGWFWLSLFSIALFILIGWQFSPLGVVWFLFLIAPFSQFKVLGQFIAERYMYLPSIGWYLILGSALSANLYVLFFVLALYVLRSHFYIPTYEKIENLYEDGIRNIPDCLANYANLGERYIHMGRLLEGKNILAKGLEISPDNFLCFCNTAAYWTQVKNAQIGIYYTEKAMRLGRIKSSWMIVKAMGDQLKSLYQYEKYLHNTVNPNHSLSLKKVENNGRAEWVGIG